MPRPLRSVLAVVAGIVLAGVIIAAIEGLNGMLFPLPPGVDLKDRESLVAFMREAPGTLLIGVLVAWALGTVVGAWLAARLAGYAHRTHGLIVGAVLLAGAVTNMLVLPHPVWFWVLALALFAPAALYGARLAAVKGSNTKGTTTPGD